MYNIMKENNPIKKRCNWILHQLIHYCKQKIANGKSNVSYYRALLTRYENELVERLGKKPNKNS